MRPLRTVRTQKSLAYRTSQLPSGSSRRVLSRVGKKPDREVVVKLDRLGRSTRDVLNLVHELEAQGAALTVLEPAFSTKDAAGPILVTVRHGGRDGAPVHSGAPAGGDRSGQGEG